ncbi:response regulator transcription factor [Novosphingobium sp. PASSN1]|uniref:response regulator n=1 Tax=Novosphingobium sp. PASSN1 TaxID=2015561 RepID=UPI000BD8D1FD|nr:response regulator transcription factor [Novosphingobium sp. PASSN1]OYU33878.1 MAG: DNA-binding response regulator [Novosphingobium sp. PASSN1]
MNAPDAALRGEHKILIIEDDEPIRERLVQAMLVHENCCVAEAGTLHEARAAFAAQKPDLILSDLRLPDGNAIAFLVEARRAAPATEILVISVLGDETTIFAAISAGASGYLLKDALPADIYATAMDVLAGGSPMSPSVARLVVMHARANQSGRQPGAQTGAAIDLSDPLTPREMEVLWGIAKGFSYSQIALQLGISANTVPSHVKAIYRKLRVDNRSSAVYEAVQHGIIRL